MVFTNSMKQNHLFRRAYQRGKSSAGSCVVVYCRKNGLKINRLGLTASTKLGHAVVRNRIRRRIREVYRLNEETFKYGYDIVIVARHGAIRAEFSELTDCLLKQFQKLDLIRKVPEHEEAVSVSDSILSESNFTAVSSPVQV